MKVKMRITVFVKRDFKYTLFSILGFVEEFKVGKIPKDKQQIINKFQ